MINKENWKENYTHISNEVIDNEKVLRVVKSGKINEYDENTYAKLVDSSFHNGIIEVKMLSRLLKDAPDFARGFIGIAYRINEDDTKFESFYVRPTNGRQCDDSVRSSMVVNIFLIQPIHLLILENMVLQNMKIK